MENGIFALKKQSQFLAVHYPWLAIQDFSFAAVLIDLGWIPHLAAHIPEVSGSKIKAKVGRYWSGM